MAGTLISPGAVLRQDLAGVVASMGYWGESFGAMDILPLYPVERRSGHYNRSPSYNYTRRVDTNRRPGTGASQSPDDLIRDTWDIAEYTHVKSFEPSNTDAYRTTEQMEMAKAQMAAVTVARDYERVVAAQIYNETNFPASGNTGAVATALWTNKATAVPIDDVNAGHAAHQIRHGRQANLLVMNDVIYRAVCQAANVIDRVKFVSTNANNGLLPLPALCDIFSVKKIVVVNSIFNSADEGQTASNSRCWSNTYAFLGYVSDQLDIEDNPQLGRSFTLQVDPESPGLDARSSVEYAGAEWVVEEYPDPHTSAKNIRAKAFRHAKLMNLDCGYLIKTVG